MTTYVGRSTVAKNIAHNPIPVPSGTASGDLMIAVIWSDTAITTKPTGWTELRYTQGDVSQYNAGYYTWIGYKIAGASEPASYAISTGGADQMAAVCHTYRPGAFGWNGTPATVTFALDSTSDTSWTVPTATTSTSSAWAMAVAARPGAETYSVSAVSNGFTLRMPGASEAQTGIFTADKLVGSGAIGSTVFTAPVSTMTAGYMITVVDVPNGPPNAPTLTNPDGSTTIDLTASNIFTWTFSDPDVGDTQSAYELRYRIVGAPSWTTTGMVTSTASSRTIAASTFTAGNYEWQVLTYDSLGVVGPFSASSFFTAASPPATPTITAPTSGATISSSTGSVTWSAPNQTDYQVRKVADAAGSPDTATVYYDSGTITTSVTRTASLTFPTNSRYEHIQVRVRYAGLWSSWASVRVNVSYTPPAVPTAVVTSNTPTGAVTISATHPTPAGSQPTVTTFDVYRRVSGDSSNGIRVAATVAAASSFVDWTIPSGVVMQYRVNDNGSNGTSTYSAWV